jgi:hypothetical protein
MGKFSKRIKKINKHYRNGVVLWSGFGNIDDLLESTSTIFIVYPKDDTLRRKNLIYRENLESIHALYDIDFVFIDKDMVNLIPELKPLWKRAHCLLIVEGDPSTSMEHNKFLRKERFQIIDIGKNWHIWKIQ